MQWLNDAATLLYYSQEDHIVYDSGHNIANFLTNPTT